MTGAVQRKRPIPVRGWAFSFGAFAAGWFAAGWPLCRNPALTIRNGGGLTAF